MAEIFLGYILSFLDFIYKVSVVALTAKAFGWISGPQILSSSTTPASGQDVGTARGASGKSAAPNPLGDIFSNVLKQMGPVFQEALKPKDSKTKPAVNFSDEPEEGQSALPSESLETPSAVPLTGDN
jgi:hypothetical protein